MTVLRTTQVVTEVPFTPIDPNLRITQNVIEVPFTPITPAKFRNTQNVAEVVYKLKNNSSPPDEDLSVGSWTPTPIYSIINKDDGSSVYSALTPSNDQFEVGIQDITNYDSNQDLKVKVKFSKVDLSNNDADDGDEINLIIDLREDNTTRETWVIEDIKGQEFTLTLYVDQTIKDLIQDATKLSLRVTADTIVIDAPNFRKIKLEYLVVQSTTESTVTTDIMPVLFKPFVKTSASGITKLQNPGGEINKAWQPIDGETTSDIDTINTKNSNRFNKSRYYTGDSDS